MDFFKEDEIGFNYIKSSLEHAVDSSSKAKIDNLLKDISNLRDPERLLLCLSIPADSSSSLSASLCLTGDDFDINSTIDGSQIYGGSGPNSALHLSNQLEQSQAYTWIMSHLEEDPSTCLRKDEVFEDYRLYCERHHLKVLNTADFGKVMKRAFPNVKPRRLGQRGQSRYCYGGMRKKFEVQPPCLPDLTGEINGNKNQSSNSDMSNKPIDPVVGVAGSILSDVASIILQYIQQVLGINFSSLYQVAQHLITNRYVNTRSKHAFSFIAYMTSNAENSQPTLPKLNLNNNIQLPNAHLLQNTFNPDYSTKPSEKKRNKSGNSSDSDKKFKQVKHEDVSQSITHISNGGSTGGSSSSSTPTPYPTSSSANDLHGSVELSSRNQSNHYSSMYNVMMAMQQNSFNPASTDSNAMAMAAAMAAQKLNIKKPLDESFNLSTKNQSPQQQSTTTALNSLTSNHSQGHNGQWNSPMTPPRPLQPTIGAKSPFTQTHGINQFNKRNQPPSDAPGSYNPTPSVHYGNLSPSKRFRCDKNNSVETNANTSNCQPSRYIEALGMLSPVPQSGCSVNSYLNIIDNDCPPTTSDARELNEKKFIHKNSTSISNTSRYLQSAAFTLSLDDDSCYDGDLPRLGASPGPSELFHLMDNKSDPYKNDSTCQTPVDICALNNNNHEDEDQIDDCMNRTLTEKDEDAVARANCGGVDTPPALSPQDTRSNLLLLEPSSPTENSSSKNIHQDNNNMGVKNLVGI